ncbi:MAG: YkvA family protein [Lautropia sp.]
MLWLLRIRRLFKTTGREALILWYAFRNPGTPASIRLGSLLLLAYLISPVDLLPDFALLFGWADDLALLMLGIPFLVNRLPPHVLSDAAEKADRRLGRFREQT